MNYTKAKLKIHEQELFSKIYKIRDREKEEYDTLKDLSCTDVGREQLNALKNLIECYDALLETNPKSMSELEDIEWVFNNGKLRTEEEIKEHTRLKEQQDYRNRLFIPNLMRLDCIGFDLLKIRVLIVFAIAPILPMKMVLESAYFPGQTYEAAWLFFIPLCPISLLICLFISGFIGLIINQVIEDKRSEEFLKAGVNKKVNTNLIISTVAYGASLAYILHAFKKKKR